MKLAVSLALVLVYCTMFAVATQNKKSGQTKNTAPTPTRTPTPSVTPKPATTPAVRVTPTPSPTPAPTATATPPPGPVASPTTSPAPDGGAAVVKVIPFAECKDVTVLPGITLCSKTQPGDDLVLCPDCDTKKPNPPVPPRDPEGNIGPARFTHTAHATKKYSVDGKSVIGCAECHHTDQPASALQPPYKTSQRAVALVAATLNDANAAPVFACRACHTPVGMKPRLLEALPPAADPDPDPLVTNKVAYHINCIVCHQNANGFAGRTPRVNAPDTCTSCHR